ncbi:uncharacterized protein FOMMEDRAFT_168328 [Fomitiporia mediterranea MF3/22]|uniref:uncharacterized protein n=1 Tax=Fomitiporia mediterranea (strain MF3/22) TaxID=694068 RepID=UPI00044097E8|nr:uncharacterized protein FOMMEDRAFT_168328 [Fomitiporia mediterranea MF3/22]EJD03344.1 hypothetical protein FOMMEDRAFT_168328 [Fomitiporia mediterranea MF3/22]
MVNPTLDPYTANAVNDDVTPQKKIEDLKSILKVVKTGMLTTRDKDGMLHSRAMTPAGPYSDTQLTLTFLANNVSHKFEELQQDSHVNISFFDEKTTNWASFAGTATVSQDRELIKKLWSPITAAYFGDLKDGVHKGDENDPRISVIEVIPEEIQYWIATRGALGRTVENAFDAVTGKTSAPGEIRKLSSSEIQLTQGLHTKQT